MPRLPELFDLLGELVTYPAEGYPDGVRRCQELAAPEFPEAAAWLGRFVARVAPLTLTELEELFTGTFDLDPACTLDVGWHLFGENYTRGEFLVRMRQELRRHGLAESTELPDHLTHVLELLGRLNTARACDLAAGSVLPALDRMLAGLAGKDNPYADLLGAVRELVQFFHGPVTAEVGHG